jgi:hypothetical protein
MVGKRWGCLIATLMVACAACSGGKAVSAPTTTRRVKRSVPVTYDAALNPAHARSLTSADGWQNFSVPMYLPLPHCYSIAVTANDGAGGPYSTVTYNCVPPWGRRIR